VDKDNQCHIGSQNSCPYDDCFIEEKNAIAINNRMLTTIIIALLVMILSYSSD